MADDSECRRTAEARRPESKRIGTTQMAGHDVVRYQSAGKNGIVAELSLAPQLACEVVEEVITWPGTIGIPGAKWQYQVISYKPGEPDSNLFRVPAGYIIQQKNQ